MPDRAQAPTGQAAAIVRDLAKKVTQDVRDAIMRTALLADTQSEMLPVMLGAQQGIVHCVAALCRNSYPELTLEQSNRVAMELLILQLDTFAGTPIEVASARMRARLAEAGLDGIAPLLEPQFLR